MATQNDNKLGRGWWKVLFAVVGLFAALAIGGIIWSQLPRLSLNTNNSNVAAAAPQPQPTVVNINLVPGGDGYIIRNGTKTAILKMLPQADCQQLVPVDGRLEPPERCFSQQIVFPERLRGWNQDASSPMAYKAIFKGGTTPVLFLDHGPGEDYHWSDKNPVAVWVANIQKTDLVLQWRFNYRPK